MEIQVSAWKDDANFWQSKYRHQNCYPQILENVNKFHVPIKKLDGQITPVESLHLLLETL
ncbi:hypothetical protein K3495_g13051 [Podosphaera aphanis]|nr:hypothetical protein K3495_g13051 [Podosphaera aphanis]